jgi:hypothetical protein
MRAWRAHPLLLVVAASLVVAALSLLVRSSPGYDPWAWLVWGHEVAHLDLNTDKGPSWKPLPIALTTLLSLAGGAAPTLWILLTRAAALVAVALAFRVAARLAERAKVLAGLVAAGGVVLGADFLESALRGWSELLLAACLLAAVDLHLDGRRRGALALLFAASLVRPEAWPFLGIYAIVLWRRDRGSRPLVAGLLALVPVLWFGPDLVASGDPLRSQRRAQQPLPGRPGLAEHPALEVLRQGRPLLPVPFWILAGIALVESAVAYARRRRHAATLVLAVGAAGWIGTVAVMSELGYTGNPRYLLPAIVVVAVVAGVGAAWVAGLAQREAERRSARPNAGRLAALGASVVLLAVLVPSAVEAAGDMDATFDRIRSQEALTADLDDAVEAAGGRDAVLACGQVFTGPFEFPMVAWTLEIHMADIRTTPEPPGVVFVARPARGEPDAPAAPFTRRARTDRWDVYAACAR